MMQSYLNIWETGFLTLEIGYFLLCAVSQFKTLSVTVILSTFINLACLFLLQQSFQLGALFPQTIHMAVFGFILFALFSLAILNTDNRENKSRTNVATKIPFIGLGIGFYLPAPYIYWAFALALVTLGQFFYHHRDKYRLYFRTYFFTSLFTVFSVLSWVFAWPSLFALIFIFFVIIYLNQLLNLLMVKAYLQKELSLQVNP